MPATWKPLAVLMLTGSLLLLNGAVSEAALQFGAPTLTNLQTSSLPRSIATGDFDGDGDNDVAVAVCGTDCGGTGTGAVRVLVNNGTGGFLPGPSLFANGPRDVAVGDVNND